MVIRSPANPVGHMVAQIHISPQTFTGNITRNNYQVFYKNDQRSVPIGTRVGLSNPVLYMPFNQGVYNSNKNSTQLFIDNNIREETNSTLNKNRGTYIDLSPIEVIGDLQNIGNSTISVIDLLDNVTEVRRFNTSLDGITLPVSILPVVNTENDSNLPLSIQENTGTINFTNNNSRPPRIDGVL